MKKMEHLRAARCKANGETANDDYICVGGDHGYRSFWRFSMSFEQMQRRFSAILTLFLNMQVLGQRSLRTLMTFFSGTCGSCYFEEVEENWEGSKQPSGSTSVPSR